MPRRAAARDLASSASVFAALGDPTRLQLVHSLCQQGPQSISDLSQTVAVTRQAVTKHLQVLEGAGLASSAREGRQSVWKLQPRALGRVTQWLEQISGQWDDALQRLREHVEG